MNMAQLALLVGVAVGLIGAVTIVRGVVAPQGERWGIFAGGVLWFIGGAIAWSPSWMMLPSP